MADDDKKDKESKLESKAEESAGTKSYKIFNGKNISRDFAFGIAMHLVS